MLERRAIKISGTVQGVGFRPFVYRLATARHLSGFVRNHGAWVAIEVQGEPASLDAFLHEVQQQPPPLARIQNIACELRPLQNDPTFVIQASGTAMEVAGEGWAVGGQCHQNAAHGPAEEASDPAGTQVIIAPDTATCADCLAELFHPGDRRFRYPFINCTNCGPRLTIVTGSPYDRAATTMATFKMCPACRAEYQNPLDRRFHAQPVACANCGPHMTLADCRGTPLPSADPIHDFATHLLAGKIGALKGIGGYHLTCDARNPSAVNELRQRKAREEKPLAVMVPTLAAARTLCLLTPEEQALLLSPQRPIVLLQKLPDTAIIAAAVAPNNPSLGIMLPYSPIHHLLLQAVAGVPLVMTSGNRSDEPIAFTEPDAFTRLAHIADIFLTHNRPIHLACDDSVTRVIAGAEHPIRRSRGYAPAPLELPFAVPAPLLAVGGQQKSVFGLAMGRSAILSHHLGDLDHFSAAAAFEQNVALYEQLFSIHPALIVHDLHPDYSSTRYAHSRHQRDHIPLLAVQHHHAHMAGCMAEYGLTGPAIGVTLDGTGLGTDGKIWGGEFLVGGYKGFRRAGHLRYVMMPGGEKAVREPWRMAAAHLWDAEATYPSWEQRMDALPLAAVRQMMARGFNSPQTSSAGRLFDAAASLAGLRDRASYEGQGAVELEAAAAAAPGPADPYRFAIETAPATNFGIGSLIADTRTMIRDIASARGADCRPERIARRFHVTLAAIIVEICERIRQSEGVNVVVLSGGVFMNRLLCVEADQRLTDVGFRTYYQQRAPANDGGLALGQLSVASAQWKSAR